MAVAEPIANRVSLYLTVPADGTTLPQALLGTDTFTASNGACTRSQLTGPRSVAITPDGNNLVVADTGNNRVNIYFGYPTVPPAPDMGVHLGQPTSGTCLPNGPQGNPNLGHLNQPTGVWTDGSRIVVADTGNNRVLVWSTFPPAGVDQGVVFADFVLGQISGASVLPNRGAPAPDRDTLSAPTHVASDGTRLAVADTGNHRVLIWNTFPTGETNGAPADVVLGQDDFTRSLPNDPDQVGGSDGPSAEVFFRPTGLLFHAGKLYVSDQDNNRFLIFEPQ
jgi:DNA-binding beta-propeller fold protein YncE